jgi:YqaJ-like viral recombinase domain
MACGQYEQQRGITVSPSGFTLHNEYPYLGASADGIIDNSVVLEIKCPYSGRDKTISELINSGYDHIQYGMDDKLQLKVNSNYYCQVQGEMAIKKVTKSHFVVWTPKDMAVIDVPFDEQYWNEILLPALKKFYENHILPTLLQ